MNFIDEKFLILSQRNPIVASCLTRHQKAQVEGHPIMWVQTLEAMVFALAEQNEVLVKQLEEAMTCAPPPDWLHTP